MWTERGGWREPSWVVGVEGRGRRRHSCCLTSPPLNPLSSFGPDDLVDVGTWYLTSSWPFLAPHSRLVRAVHTAAVLEGVKQFPGHQQAARIRIIHSHPKGTVTSGSRVYTVVLKSAWKLSTCHGEAEGGQCKSCGHLRSGHGDTVSDVGGEPWRRGLGTQRNERISERRNWGMWRMVRDGSWFTKKMMKYKYQLQERIINK